MTPHDIIRSVLERDHDINEADQGATEILERLAAQGFVVVHVDCVIPREEKPQHHCTCDPHGDNAKCDRPCCKPRQAPIPTPTSEDLQEATKVLRLVAWQTRSKPLADTLNRVSDWLEGKAR